MNGGNRVRVRVRMNGGKLLRALLRPCFIHTLFVHVLCTGYFPGNGHDYCWPCAPSSTANILFLIGGSICIFSLWGLMSFGINSVSAVIFLGYLQLTNVILVSFVVVVVAFFVCSFPHIQSSISDWLVAEAWQIQSRSQTKLPQTHTQNCHWIN